MHRRRSETGVGSADLRDPSFVEAEISLDKEVREVSEDVSRIEGSELSDAGLAGITACHNTQLHKRRKFLGMRAIPVNKFDRGESYPASLVPESCPAPDPLSRGLLP